MGRKKRKHIGDWQHTDYISGKEHLIKDKKEREVTDAKDFSNVLMWIFIGFIVLSALVYFLPKIKN